MELLFLRFAHFDVMYIRLLGDKHQFGRKSVKLSYHSFIQNNKGSSTYLHTIILYLVLEFISILAIRVIFFHQFLSGKQWQVYGGQGSVIMSLNVS